MIDRIRLTAAAKIQLSTLKRKTGIEHYNSICRHALCISLANPSIPPKEDLNFTGGIEIDWRTFTGNEESLYVNIVILRMKKDSMVISADGFRSFCSSHLHRGLSYLAAKEDSYLVSAFLA